MIRNSNDQVALVNGKLVLPDRIESGTALIIDRSCNGGKISSLINEDHLPAHIECVDAGGRWIAPGLIDIHNHGALGYTFNEPDEEACEKILLENARNGVTALLATIAACPINDIVKALDFFRAWMSKQRSGARILGVHLESPYINRLQCGALDPKSLASPLDGSSSLILDYADILRILVLAPELPGAIELIRLLANRGIIPAAGHSMAKEKDVLAAMEAGLRHVTHVFSAMSTTTREGPWRTPGLLETALVNEGLTVEMIADNKHLPPTLMKLAYRCIGHERLCIISDATSGAGLPEGTRYRMGQMEYEVFDGVGMMLDRSAFAGSTTLLGKMIPILITTLGIPICETIKMTSLNPARLLNLEKRKGSLEDGKDADLVIFNFDFSVWKTMISGQWIS